MTPGPALLEAIGSVVVAMVGSSIAAPVIALLRRKIADRERVVTLKFPSGRRINLELDGRLSEDVTSELVAEAVRSAQAGDDDGVRQAIDASHAASRGAREAAEARHRAEDRGQPALL